MSKKQFEVKITHVKLVKFEIPAENEKEAISSAMKLISESPELYLSIEAHGLINNGFNRDHGY